MSTTSEEDILRKHLQCLEKQGNTWTGYVESKEQYDELLRDLASISISFQTERSSKRQGKLLLSSERGHVHIKEIGVPFKVVRTTDKGCLFGRDVKGVQGLKISEEKETEGSAATCKQKKVKLQGTKKKGCTAMMHIKEIEIYPEFQTNLSNQCSKWKHQLASEEVFSRLELALQEETDAKPVLRMRRFYVSMSDKDSHCNHDVDACCAGYAQPVSADLSKKVIELVQQRVTSVKTMESCQNFYVKEALFANKQSPCREFYPTKRDLAIHIQSALSKDRVSTLDQENVANCVEQLRKKMPTTRIFFRAHQEQCPNLSKDNEQEDAELDSDIDEKEASHQRRRHMLSEIRARGEQILSSLDYVQDDAVLEHVLNTFNETKALVDKNMATCSGIAIRGSPTKVCSGIKRKGKKKTAPAKRKQIASGLAKQDTAKEHWVCRGRVGQKAETLRQTYKAPVLLYVVPALPQN